MKSINVKGGLYSLEGGIFQITLEIWQYIEVKQYKKYEVLALNGYIFNKASGSEANMTTLCEMDFLNFKWLI